MKFTLRLRTHSEWDSAPSGSELKVRVYVGAEMNRPDHHHGHVTATLVSMCEADVLPTLTPTATETPTPTPDETATETPPAEATATPTFTPPPPHDGSSACTGAQPHPTGMKLAQRYGVPYEEIMGWFCQGFGFGEIDLAYSLSLESGVPVSNLFDMKRSGDGWGNIKKEFSPKPTKEPKNKK